MKIAIITGNSYPNGDAGAVRQHAMAKLLLEMGHDVFVIGYGQPTNGKVEQFDGVCFISFRGKSSNVVMRAVNRLLFGNRVLHYLKKELADVKCLLVVDLLPAALCKVRKYAIRKNISLIHDSVEWYSPEEFSKGEKSRAFRNKEYTNTVAIDENWSVIAISKYLENHFKTRCKNVVRIPVIMDMKTISPRLNAKDADKIMFMYAGSPGRKDFLKEMLVGFSLLDEADLQQIEIHIIGVNQDQLMRQCGVEEKTIKKLGDALHAHGRVPRDKVVTWVKQADYTLLLRDETLRYAKAGFPTKVVESLACGTPVVCNLSSDLEDYLEDGINAFVIPGHKPEDVRVTILRIIKNGKPSVDMRMAARDSAEKCFDYHNYLDQMQTVLQEKA